MKLLTFIGMVLSLLMIGAVLFLLSPDRSIMEQGTSYYIIGFVGFYFFIYSVSVLCFIILADKNEKLG